jgi:hypothetical protein
MEIPGCEGRIRSESKQGGREVLFALCDGCDVFRILGSSARVLAFPDEAFTRFQREYCEQLASIEEASVDIEVAEDYIED